MLFNHRPGTLKCVKQFSRSAIAYTKPDDCHGLYTNERHLGKIFILGDDRSGDVRRMQPDALI